MALSQGLNNSGKHSSKNIYNPMYIEDDIGKGTGFSYGEYIQLTYVRYTC